MQVSDTPVWRPGVCVKTSDRKEHPNMKRVIIILGMHRSGTSAMAGALQCMGVDLGSRLMAATEGANDAGYFEHVDIVDLHERLLSSLGSNWDDLRPLPRKWWKQDGASPFRKELLEILRRDFGDSHLWGIKDPRMCRLMPLWYSVLDELDVSPLCVLVFRHPEEVAVSLHRRDEMDLSRGYLLWINHVLEAEVASRGKMRVFVRYEDLLGDSHQIIRTVSGRFGIAWPTPPQEGLEALDRLISPALHHCHTQKKKMAGVIRNVYDILLRAGVNGEMSSEDQDRLDHIREGLMTASEALMPALAETSRLMVSGRRAREEAERLNEVERHLREVIAGKEQQTHELQLHCNEFEQIVQHRDAAIEAQKQEASRRDATIEAQKQEASRRDATIEALVNSTSWKLTSPVRFVGRQCKRVGLLWSLRSMILFFGNGVTGTVGKSFRVFRKEGVAGLRKRLARIHRSGTASAEGDMDYAEWIRRYDTLTDDVRQQMRRDMDCRDRKPLISVVMPTYNSDIDFLTAAIESVRMQIYPAWQLCIADDASTAPEVIKLLEHYETMDNRINVVFRKHNGHISEASNSALALAEGEFVALLDHDDMLAEHALYMAARELNQYPGANIIYSDEDKIDADGRRYDPHFKPDWNPDMFRSQNYISHLGIYRTTLVRDVGGFRKGYEGSQDYDLCLRCAARAEEGTLRHIPHILYHWRAAPGSTALSADEKSYAEKAAMRALDDVLAGEATAAVVEKASFPTTYRVRYPLPKKPPMVSIIIPTRNGYDILHQCIESIRIKTDYPNYEILVVDNQSDDEETLDYLAHLAKAGLARVLSCDEPFNFSAINNFAVARAAGSVIALVNNDIEVITAEWLSEMVAHAMRPGIGAVGAKLFYGDGRIQHAGVIVGVGGVAGHSHKYYPHDASGYFCRLHLVRNVSAVTAACLVIRRSIYEEVGGLDEEHLRVAFNDVDFCLRVRESGYRNLWTPYAELYHHESVSRGAEDTPEKQTRFAAEIKYMKRKWGDELRNDPAYNPNLTLDHEDFSVARPPYRKLWTVK